MSQLCNQVLVSCFAYGLTLAALFTIIFIVYRNQKRIEDTRNGLISIYYLSGFYLLSAVKHFSLLQYRSENRLPFDFDCIVFILILVILVIIASWQRNNRKAPIIIMTVQALLLGFYQIICFKGPTNLLWCSILCSFSFGISLVWRIFFLYEGVFMMIKEEKDQYVSQWKELTGELFSYAITVLIALAATLGVALTILYNGSQNIIGGWNGIEIISESIIFIIGYCWVALGFIAFIGLPYLHNRKAIMYMDDSRYTPDAYVKKYSRQLDGEEAVYGNEQPNILAPRTTSDRV